MGASAPRRGAFCGSRSPNWFRFYTNEMRRVWTFVTPEVFSVVISGGDEAATGAQLVPDVDGGTPRSGIGRGAVAPAGGDGPRSTPGSGGGPGVGSTKKVRRLGPSRAVFRAGISVWDPN